MSKVSIADYVFTEPEFCSHNHFDKFTRQMNLRVIKLLSFNFYGKNRFASIFIGIAQSVWAKIEVNEK